MRKGFFYAPDGGTGSGTGSGDGEQGGGAGAGGGQGTDVAAKLAALETELAKVQRDKLQLEKDLHKERDGKKRTDEEAKLATERAAALKATAVKLAKELGVEIPGDDPSAELAAKLKVVEEDKRKAADQERETRLSRLTIERELLKALAGKVEDLDYALYKAGRTAAYSDLKVEGDKVSGIEAVVKELSDAGILKTGKDDGQQKKAPGAGGQPPLQGEKYPWRETKTWQEFVKLPWPVQQEAEAKDPGFIKELQSKFNAT